MKMLILFLGLVLTSYAGTLTAVGDVMLGTIYPEPSMMDSCPKDPLQVLQTVPKTSIVFCNMEGVLLNMGTPEKHCDHCFLFRMPEGFISQYKAFNLISLSNNHSRDFGNKGIKTTEGIFRQNGIHFGSYASPWDTFTIDGTKYGFCAFNVAWHRVEEAESVIASMKGMYSILIVSMHGGAEGNGYTHVTKKDERYYGENRGNVYQFAHKCIDAGASIILGHGPHVTRAVELYKNKFIAYSMGNFATCGFKIQGGTATAPILQIEFDEKGNFVSGEIYPIRQEKYKAPVIDPDRVCIKEIRSLTVQDFPKTRLAIDDDGNIRRK